jgi:hypothetical protein
VLAIVAHLRQLSVVSCQFSVSEFPPALIVSP